MPIILVIIQITSQQEKNLLSIGLKKQFTMTIKKSNIHGYSAYSQAKQSASYQKMTSNFKKISAWAVVDICFVWICMKKGGKCNHSLFQDPLTQTMRIYNLFVFLQKNICQWCHQFRETLNSVIIAFLVTMFIAYSAFLCFSMSFYVIIIYWS